MTQKDFIQLLLIGIKKIINLVGGFQNKKKSEVTNLLI